jgi:hypothetical protein
MTLGLSPQLDAAFGRAGTAVLVTLDGAGHPIATTSRVEHDPAAGCFGLDVALGLPDPHAALVLADGVDDLVLVQGTARPAGATGVQVRPERVYRWTDGDLEAEPELYDAHLEEVRAAHNQEPETGHAPPEGGPPAWDPRLDELGTRYATAAVSFVGPDGFPFAVRVPVRADRAAGVVRIEADPEGAPIEPGLACLCAHDHPPDFSWQRNFQVRGDLEEDHGGWLLRPHKLVGGFELPPTSAVDRYRQNGRKVLRFRRIAKREMAKRGR